VARLALQAAAEPAFWRSPWISMGCFAFDADHFDGNETDDCDSTPAVVFRIARNS
jgi:hypothetical protein